DVPEPHRSDGYAPGIARDEGEPFRRPPAAAQLLRRFPLPIQAHGASKQCLARSDVRGIFWGYDEGRHTRRLVQCKFHILKSFTSGGCSTSEPVWTTRMSTPGDLKAEALRSRRIGAARSR